MSDENPQPGQPDGVLAYILRELVEVQTSVAMLEARALAQSHAIDALAIALPASERSAALALLQAQQQLLAADGDDAAAVFLEDLLQRIGSLLGDGTGRSIGEVAAAAGLTNALVQSAPPGLAKPMRTWLSLASEGEIAQDAAQLPPEQLAALLRLHAALKPARRGGAKRKKKWGDEGWWAWQALNGWTRWWRRRPVRASGRFDGVAFEGDFPYKKSPQALALGGDGLVGVGPSNPKPE